MFTVSPLAGSEAHTGLMRPAGRSLLAPVADCIVSNDRMNDGCRIGKDLERGGGGIIAVGYFSCIFLERLGKTTKNLIQDGRCPTQDSIQALTNTLSGALTLCQLALTWYRLV